MITILVSTLLLTRLILVSNGNPTEEDNEQPLASRSYKGRYYDASEPGFIISSPNIVRDVKWTSWKYCMRGAYVSAFQVTSGNVWGVSGMKLYCVKLNSDRINEENVLTTPKSRRGKWGSIFKCEDGLFTGFNARLELDKEPNLIRSPYRKGSKGITNIRMMCSNPKTGTLEGDGLDAGEYYTKNQICGQRMAICGMRVQVDTVDLYGWSRGITQVEMKCCKIPDHAGTCKALSKYESIQECRNGGLTDLICKYSYTQGVKEVTSETNTKSHSKMSSVGFTLSASLPKLFLNFASTLTGTKNTDQTWGAQSSSTWNEQKTVWAEIKVPPGENLVIEQIAGTCGDFRIGSPKIRVRPTSGMI